MNRAVILSAFLAVALASPYSSAPSPSTNLIFSSPPEPIDCQYSPWTPYTECSESCGKQGTRSRTRRIISRAQNGGKPCDPSLLEEWEQCFTPCFVDCVMEEWGPWSICHVNGGQQCGIGRRERHRGILVQAQNGGRPCQERVQWETCDAGQCPRDCALGQWSQWSQCPACGRADRRRNRQILFNAAFGGRECDSSSLSEVEACQTSPCAVDCVMGAWSQYSQCQSDNGQSCGQGRRSRQRSITVVPKFGGQQCQHREESQTCDLGPCAVDCVMGPWSQYTQCQSNNGQTCGQGSRSRQRSILVQSQFGGRPCEQTQQTDGCNLGPCPIDCVMGPWSQYTQCQSSNGQTCGQGLRTRQRSILINPRFGGQQCERAVESQTCDLGPCSVDCVMSNWSTFSSCASSSGEICGFGRRSRRRSILVQAQFGGRQCEQAEQFEACNLGPCPVDCVLSPWSEFGPCSSLCGSGTRSRFRRILVPAQFGGRPCSRVEDVTICQNQPCFDPPSCIGRPIEFYINPAEPCSPNYWKCIDEQTHAKVCQSGLVFNPDALRCDSPSQVRACRQSTPRSSY